MEFLKRIIAQKELRKRTIVELKKIIAVTKIGTDEQFDECIEKACNLIEEMISTSKKLEGCMIDENHRMKRTKRCIEEMKMLQRKDLWFFENQVQQAIIGIGHEGDAFTVMEKMYKNHLKNRGEVIKEE